MYIQRTVDYNECVILSLSLTRSNPRIPVAWILGCSARCDVAMNPISTSDTGSPSALASVRVLHPSYSNGNKFSCSHPLPLWCSAQNQIGPLASYPVLHNQNLQKVGRSDFVYLAWNLLSTLELSEQLFPNFLVTYIMPMLCDFRLCC
jgi:hypothetical protein